MTRTCSWQVWNIVAQTKAHLSLYLQTFSFSLLSALLSIMGRARLLCSPLTLNRFPAIDSAPAAALVWRLVILFRTRSCSSGRGYSTGKLGKPLRKVTSVNQAANAGRMMWRWVIKTVRTRMKVERSLAVLLCLSEGETRDESQIKCSSCSYEVVSRSVSC